jgi:hypothetical protein
MAKSRGFNRGSATVKVKTPSHQTGSKVSIRDVDEKGNVKVTSRKKYGRFSSSFINKEGNYQYLVGYDPSLQASIHVVRPILPSPSLPSLPPSNQGDIMELKLYYLDDDGKQVIKTYDAKGSKYKYAYEQWMRDWDEICEGSGSGSG